MDEAVRRTAAEDEKRAGNRRTIPFGTLRSALAAASLCVFGGLALALPVFLLASEPFARALAFVLGSALSTALAAASAAARASRRLAQREKAARDRETALEHSVMARADELVAAYNELADKHDAMRRELRVARDIQSCIVGRLGSLPPRPELSIGAWYRAMDNVGGDLYDVVRIGKNSYGFLMADVAGHGIPAALITALVKVAFDGKASWGIRPEGVCDAVNRVLCQLVADQDRFVTAWYGILDLENGRLLYTNAGHHPPLLLHADGSLERPDTECPPLGIFEDAPYYSMELSLKPGDRMLLFTDGIVEAMNYLKEQYGNARLLSLFEAGSGLEPQAAVDALVRDLDVFVSGAPASDDRAALAFEFRAYAKALEE